MPQSNVGSALARPEAVSPKLAQLVGHPNAAARIARAYAAPHAGFFALDAPRQNVLRLAATKSSFDVDAAREAESWALRRLIEALIPDGPQGLAEALRKLGDNPVHLANLEQLVEILRGDGAKLIRHSQEITTHDIVMIGLLPPALQRMRILASLESQGAARLLAAGARVVCRDGCRDKDMTKLAHRIERARSAQAMFRMLVEEIGLEVLAPPPIAGADWFRPINTVPKIKDAALRFRNCLTTRIGWLLSGHGAYYEVLGEEPAVVEIVRDHRGAWRLGEALGHANAPLTQPLRQRIHAYLESQKVALRSAMYDDLAAQLARAAGY